MIVSRYFQEAKYARHLRTFLSQRTILVHLVDFQNFQIFGAEVNVLASIVIMRRRVNDEVAPVFVMRLTNDKTDDFALSAALTNQNKGLFDSFSCTGPIDGEVWNFKKTEDARIDEKLSGCSLRLDDIASVVQSMQTGLNEVLAPSLGTLANYDIEQVLIHPIVKAGSILRYEFEDLNHALIWTEGIEIDRYPHTKKYLHPFQDDLGARYDIKSRKANWWEISNPRNADLFFSNRPRILVPFIATGNKFCVDDSKHLNDGGDIRGIFFREMDSPYSEYYVCALLNSKTCEYYHLRNTKLKRGGYYEYFEGQLSALPIRRINFTLSPDQRAYYHQKAKTLYNTCLEKGDQQCVLGFVDHHITQEPEESDVVHDLLAMLAEEMMRLNKEKRTAQRDF